MPESGLSPNRSESSRWLPLFIWALFLAGVLLQLFSPHLKISHDSFVVPLDMVGRGAPIDPRALIRQERMVQLFSALLTLSGAIGLGLYYRGALLRDLLGRGHAEQQKRTETT